MSGVLQLVKAMADWYREKPERHAKDYLWANEDGTPMKRFGEGWVPGAHAPMDPPRACLYGCAELLSPRDGVTNAYQAMLAISQTLNPSNNDTMPAIEYNNAETTTPQDIIALLDRTAARLEGVGA